MLWTVTLLWGSAIKYAGRGIACSDKIHKESMCRLYMKIEKAFFRFKYMQLLLKSQFNNLKAENNNLFVSEFKYLIFIYSVCFIFVIDLDIDPVLHPSILATLQCGLSLSAQSERTLFSDIGESILL